MRGADSTVPHGEGGAPLRTFRVEVIEGPDRGLSKLASAESLSIGTADGNDLRLTDETVSRFHVDLIRLGDRIRVKDHESTNGTACGGAGIIDGWVYPGATLSLGATRVRVMDDREISVETYEGAAIGGLRGRSPAMRRLLARVQRAARSKTAILLTGETGVGKEVAARALHEASDRKERPFETVDCGAILPALVASELFGHEEGAFTGAAHQHVGAFERADTGTLFLDEIGELPAGLQAALLGALERRRFRRVGGKETVDVDVRVVCATNRDLRAEVNARRFREDLYYRIAVVTFEIPPLRDRVEDIPMLVEHFLRGAGYTGSLESIFPIKALEALQSHRWPGNVRELRNVVERALIMGEPLALAEDRIRPSESETLAIRDLLTYPYNDARQQLLDTFEEVYARHLLDRANGNVTKAAQIGRMSRSYLTKLLNRQRLRGRDAEDGDG